MIRFETVMRSTKSTKEWVWQWRPWQIKLHKVSTTFRFCEVLGYGFYWSLDYYILGYIPTFNFFLLSLRQTLYINVQVWPLLENSFQISLWEQFATNGCLPAQLQQVINPVWNKIFQKKVFLMFFFHKWHKYVWKSRYSEKVTFTSCPIITAWLLIF